jgi:hypothetical protein
MRLSPTHHLSFSPARWRRLRGGGVQLERSDACNDNAASLTSIALHQPHWRTGYSLRLFVRRFTIFRRGGRLFDQVLGQLIKSEATVWGPGVDAGHATVGGRIGNESNQWRLLPLVPLRGQEKETSERRRREESCGTLSSKLDPFTCLSTRFAGRHQT